MGKSFHKYAIIEIEYNSIMDLKLTFNEILNDFNSGHNYARKKIGNCFCEYKTTDRIQPDFRIEQINGNECMVFQSKMNKNGK